MRKLTDLMRKLGITKEMMTERKRVMNIKLAKKGNRERMLESKAKRR